MFTKNKAEHTITPMLVKSRQAAAFLAISERTLYEKTKSGDIPCVRIGRSVRYSVDDLRGYVQSQSTRK